MGSGEEQLQKIAYEAQLYQQQGQAVRQQLDLLQATGAEIEATLEALKSLKSSGGKLLPVGAGAFIRARQLESEHVLVNVGAGVVLEVPVPDAIALLEKRAAAAKEASARMQSSLSGISQKLFELDSAASKLIKEGNIDVRPPEE